MFKLWRLKRLQKKIDAAYGRDIAKLKKAKAPGEEIDSLEFQQWGEIREVQKDIDIELAHRVREEADKYDVPIPPFRGRGTEEMWTEESEGPQSRAWLSSQGRSHVRKLIAEEKARRFETRTLWITKLILPLLAVFVGIIGALTGLVAVLKHKQ